MMSFKLKLTLEFKLNLIDLSQKTRSVSVPNLAASR